MTTIPTRVGRTTPVTAGSLLEVPLTDARADVALLHVVADVDRDLRPTSERVRPDLLDHAAGGVLVSVEVAGHTVLPGAYVRRDDLARALVLGHRRVVAADLRFPAVVLGDAPGSVLAWGETRWPLPLDPSLAVPEACRPGVHSLSQLRRLVLVALGRRDDVALTLWRDPDLEVPWHDVRLAPRARWWFELAQVPPGMRYADAARSQGVAIERFLPTS